MGRFETRWLTAEKNLSTLADLSGQWIDTVHGCRPPRGIMLDMDSSMSPTHGEQENSVWNGHYACTCYHPLFLFNQFGDLERCALRPGNVHSADGWDEVLKPVVARYRGKVSLIYFRADAGLPIPRSTNFSKPNGSNTPYVCRQTASCRNGSDMCSNVPLAVRRMMCAGPTRASPIRLEAGRDRAG
jgi:Transposase DDE domain group 1